MKNSNKSLIISGVKNARRSRKKVTWAASLGDRSENADYQYNKKRLREIDRRVRYLAECLENLKIVYYSPQQEGKVFFGAWVEIENDDGVNSPFPYCRLR